MQRATGVCRYLLCSSLLSVIVEIKSLLVAYGVPYGFLDLDRDSHSKNACRQEEEQKGDSSIVLIFQEQFFISELFKNIQDAISLILHYMRM